MAASPRLTAASANRALDAAFGTPADSGKIAVYDGTQPAAGGGSITTQVKLLEFSLPLDAFPAAAGGVLTANPIGVTAGLAVGTATWYRLFDEDDVALLDGSVGESSADLVITEADITTLDVVGVLSFTITQPLL